MKQWALPPFGASGEPSASHALAQAAFTQEIFFQTAELLVEQVTRHLNQTYNYIEANGRIAVFDILLEGFAGRAGAFG